MLDEKLLKDKAIFIQNKGDTKLYIRSETAWKEAEKTDYVELKDVLQSKIAMTIPKLNVIIGFIIEFKKVILFLRVKFEAQAASRRGAIKRKQIQ